MGGALSTPQLQQCSHSNIRTDGRCTLHATATAVFPQQHQDRWEVHSPRHSYSSVPTATSGQMGGALSTPRLQQCSHSNIRTYGWCTLHATATAVFPQQNQDRWVVHSPRHSYSSVPTATSGQMGGALSTPRLQQCSHSKIRTDGWCTLHATATAVFPQQYQDRWVVHSPRHGYSSVPTATSGQMGGALSTPRLQLCSHSNIRTDGWCTLHATATAVFPQQHQDRWVVHSPRHATAVFPQQHQDRWEVHSPRHSYSSVPTATSGQMGGALSTPQLCSHSNIRTDGRYTLHATATALFPQQHQDRWEVHSPRHSYSSVPTATSGQMGGALSTPQLQLCSHSNIRTDGWCTLHATATAVFPQQHQDRWEVHSPRHSYSSVPTATSGQMGGALSTPQLQQCSHCNIRTDGRCTLHATATALFPQQHQDRWEVHSPRHGYSSLCSHSSIRTDGRCTLHATATALSVPTAASGQMGGALSTPWLQLCSHSNIRTDGRCTLHATATALFPQQHQDRWEVHSPRHGYSSLCSHSSIRTDGRCSLTPWLQLCSHSNIRMTNLQSTSI